MVRTRRSGGSRGRGPYHVRRPGLRASPARRMAKFVWPCGPCPQIGARNGRDKEGEEGRRACTLRGYARDVGRVGKGTARSDGLDWKGKKDRTARARAVTWAHTELWRGMAHVMGGCDAPTWAGPTARPNAEREGEMRWVEKSKVVGPWMVVACGTRCHWRGGGDGQKTTRGGAAACPCRLLRRACLSASARNRLDTFF